jgi:hypothetical protein
MIMDWLHWLEDDNILWNKTSFENEENLAKFYQFKFHVCFCQVLVNGNLKKEALIDNCETSRLRRRPCLKVDGVSNFLAEQLTKNLIQWLWIDYIDWKMTTFYEIRHHLTCVVLSHTYTRSTPGGDIYCLFTHYVVMSDFYLYII